MNSSEQNIQEINKFIAGLEKRFTPNKSLMLAISGHMHASVMNIFETEGADIPGGWKKKMFPGKLLMGRGDLIRSIQDTATNDSAIVYTNRRYAAIQHFGGEIKAKKMLGSVKRKKDIWAMEQYFWAMYYKSNKKEKLYKMLALHMQKHNSVTVPARPFMVLTDKFKDLIVDDIRKFVTTN